LLVGDRALIGRDLTANSNCITHPLTHSVAQEVVDAAAMLESEGFPPLVGGRWDSG
jgi:hypothetical protein